MYIDMTYIILVLPAVIFALWASSHVNSTFSKYSQQYNSRRLTGAQAARFVLDRNGCRDVRIERVSGNLTDHYDPKTNIIRLSDSVYDSTSSAAVGVACHEAGHAIQYAENYAPIKLRAAIIPITNIGSRLAMPLVLIGLLLDSFLALSNPDTGFYIAMLGVVLYGSSLLFSLVTLPVELDASRRAISMLLENRIISDDEAPAARKVLKAAAFTYLVSVLASLVYFLRFLLYVLSIFGKRRSR